MSTTRIFLFVWLVFLCHIAYAFQPQEGGLQNPRYKWLQQAEGLNEYQVRGAVIDSMGIIWLGTGDGLNRYDGTHIASYKNNPKDSLSLPDNPISAMTLDRKGRIWLGSDSGILGYKDPLSDKFHRLAVTPILQAAGRIDHMQTDALGNIWVGSRHNGLIQVSLDENSRPKYKHFLKNQQITGLDIDGQNCYAATLEGKIYVISITPVSSIDLLCTSHASRPSLVKLENELVIGNIEGLSAFDLVSKTFRPINNEKRSRVLAQTWPDHFFVAGPNGFGIWDKKTKTRVSVLPLSKERGQGIIHRIVYKALAINEYKLLLATHEGLTLVDFETPYFKTLSKDRLGQRILPSNYTTAFLKDGDRQWFGSDNMSFFMLQDQKIYDYSNFLVSNDAASRFVKDSTNNALWILSLLTKLRIDLDGFDPNAPKIKSFYDHEDHTLKTERNHGREMIIDGYGQYWTVTDSGGIQRMIIDENDQATFSYFMNDPEDSSSPPSNMYWDIESDQEGNLWMASHNGICMLPKDQLQEQKPKFINYVPQPNMANQLPHKVCVTLDFDKKGRLWVGTQQGLALHLGDGRFKSWQAQEQFPNDFIYNMVLDDAGMIWLGTNGGLSRFNPETEHFTAYGESDGLQGPSFDLHLNQNVDGIIYVGGSFGLNYFDPNDLGGVDKPVPLYFSGLTLKNHLVEAGKEYPKVLPQSLSHTKHLSIEHDQFPFSLAFSSIDYRFNKQLEYKYRLLPQNTEWTSLYESEIPFVNLPTGDYTLEINGFSRGKMWEQEPLTMSLAILPPWWASRMAYVTYLLLALLLGFWFYKFQLSRKLAVAESDRLKDMDHLKTSLYTNITHEFRTPLTVISGMVERIRDNFQDKLPDQVDQSLEMIDRNGNQLLGLVNDMLDLAKLDAQSLEVEWVQADIIPYIKYLIEGFQSLAENKQIRLVTYLEDDNLLMDFDPKKMGSILTNLLSNAIKYTPNEGEVLVHVHKTVVGEQSLLEIKVRDSGIGIAPDRLPHIFDRFYQVHDARLNNTGGTGIGLALCKELCQILGGDISAKSQKNKGSEFSFRLPIHHNAETETLELLIPGTAKKKALLMPLLQQKQQELPLALIVEDNEDVAHYLQSCLFTQYQCLYAPDGEQGIEMALEHMPDIVISDVMMPKRDGFELCETLKKDPRTDHIPIVLLTAKATQNDRLTGLGHGADAYLTKPFSKVELFTRLEQLILLRKKMLDKMDHQGYASLLKVKSKDPKTEFIKSVVEQIHKNMDNSKFGSLHLSRAVLLSESQLYRKLKAITGKSTAIFIRSIRLQHAKSVLQHSDKNVSEVAYDCGFNNPSWFSKAFKEEFGYPPSELQQSV